MNSKTNEQVILKTNGDEIIMYKNWMELAQAHEQEGYVDRVFEIDGWEKGIQSVTRSANKKTAISQFILEYPQFAGKIGRAHV